ncbi:hypothetical protein AB0L40_23750 [Patulibacter sp. NPDC049589]
MTHIRRAWSLLVLRRQRAVGPPKPGQAPSTPLRRPPAVPTSLKR